MLKLIYAHVFFIVSLNIKISRFEIWFCNIHSFFTRTSKIQNFLPELYLFIYVYVLAAHICAYIFKTNIDM